MEVIKCIPSFDQLRDLVVCKLPSQETLTSKPVIIAIGLTTASVSTYAWYRYKFTHWKSRGIDGPVPSVPFGNIIDMTKKPFDIFTEWQNKYGLFYGVYLNYVPALVVADAELIKEIVVNSSFFDRITIEANVAIEESLINKNGTEWRHDRSIMSPTFTSGKMKHMYPLMYSCIKHLDVELDKFCTKGDEFNPKETFTKLTTMVIARCAFATEVNAFTEDDQHPLVKHLMKIVTPDLFRFLVFIFTPAYLRRKLQMHASHPASFNYILSLLKNIIKTRKEKKVSSEYIDLLQLLLDTQNEPNGLSDDKIVANCFLFFLAGFETTAQTLTFIAFCLALNPEAQEELYSEIKSTVDSKGSLDYESLWELKYLDAVINETLRLYSPAPQIARVCNTETTLSNGVTIEPKTMIFLPIDAIHKNEMYHPNPDKFDPTRFLPENKQQMAPCTFIPFVAGPRNCIGMRFALLQIKLIIAETVLKYKFVKGPNTTEKLSTKFLKVRTDGILVKIEKRN